MKHTQESIREQVSAAVDGILRGRDFSGVVDALASDDALRSTWRTYHLIGDVLRSGEYAPCTDAGAFMTRLQQRLAAEAPLAARAVDAPVPATPVAAVVKPIAAQQVKLAPVAAANEPVFRWKLVAGAASLAAAAAIGWNLVGFGASEGSARTMQLAQQSQPQLQPPSSVSSNAGAVLAASPGTVPEAANSRLEATRVQVANAEPQVMLRDARLDLLLEAHRQAGGASQMPSGFLRNATFDGPAR